MAKLEGALQSSIFTVHGTNMWSLFAFTLLVNASIATLILYLFNFNLNPDYYHILAENLLEGHGYLTEPGGEPVVWRPPLYTLFLFCIYFLFGVNHTAVVVAQVIINSLTSLLIMKIADRVFSPPVGLISAIIYPFYPFSAYYLVKSQPEIVFIFLLFLFLYVLYALYDKPTLLLSFIFGLLQGALTMCKLFFKGFPIFLLCSLAALILFSFLRHRRKITGEHIKRYAALILIMLVGFSVAIMPWLLRNYTIYDDFPVFGAGGGFTVWMGNNVQFNGLDYDQLNDEQRLVMLRELRMLTEKASGHEINEESVKNASMGFEVNLANDTILYREAIKNFIRFPEETLLLLGKKIFRLWFSVYSHQMQKYQWIVYILHTLLLTAGLLGLFKAWKEGVKVVPFFILILYFQIVYTIFTATVRYIVPIAPIFICSSVYLLVKNKYLAKIGGKTRAQMFWCPSMDRGVNGTKLQFFQKAFADSFSGKVNHVFCIISDKENVRTVAARYFLSKKGRKYQRLYQ